MSRPSLGYSNYYWIRQDQKRLEKLAKAKQIDLSEETEQSFQEALIETTMGLEEDGQLEFDLVEEETEQTTVTPPNTSLMIIPKADEHKNE
jgi:Asp-tRNA(Asn)/Glu-tRNA(Gln) amidotransferase C subunit